jgi:hypothetical protein
VLLAMPFVHRAHGRAAVAPGMITYNGARAERLEVESEGVAEMAADATTA